ncbi:hypothetical protein F5Y19DRAFT_40738 [Xylariaceae sp. FL1651]|nr:hypothetical protein F5Y19DRAFT_40738 [Xylariaceae sp. FL1651]
MVTRKAVPENPSVHVSEPPRIELWSPTDSEADSERIWGEQETPSTELHQASEAKSGNDVSQQVPDPLRPGVTPVSSTYGSEEQSPWGDIDGNAKIPIRDQSQIKLEEVPNALRPGPGRSETNPFKRKPVRMSSETSSTTQQALNKPGPVSHPPTEAFSQLQVDESSEQSTNPWQPALDERKHSDVAQTPPSPPDLDSDRNVWSSGPSPMHSHDNPASLPPGPVSNQSTGNTQPWDDFQPVSSLPLVPGRAPLVNDLLGDEHVWEDAKPDEKGKQTAVLQPETQPDTADGWNLVDHEAMPEPAPGNLSKQSTWENFVDAEDDMVNNEATRDTQKAPALPPRNSDDVAPPQPPRRPSPNNAKKSETYQIKNINWHDSKAAKNPRKSPILVQNANGPCPLVALVNALTLTTPADQTSSNLVETLRSREQISLNFLLEAIVDELMSSRHTDSDAPLPDMSELYAFLQGLHTGMNVNPRFIPTPEAIAAHKRISLSHVHPSECDAGIPGTFENTRDMELYATFSIPLIHGWLPLKDEPVFDALSRQASSYDDAQNLLFREEELEDKFSNTQTGLTGEEQQLYQDILTIKSFLSLTATQLTPSGLEVVTKAIKPGDVSILFRNDHFSTLYRHPQTLQLFTLVTDAGYFTHDEVVWESLVDVRGERAEFFSGDFRVVGGTQHERAGTNDNWYDDSEAANTSNGGGWQTVQNRRSRNTGQSEPPPTTPLSPQHEQEDRDLALALQLQEEEEERHRAEQAARRRESQLSEQFIEQQGRDGSHTRTGNSRGGSVSSVNRGSTSSLPPPRGSSASLPARAGAQARGGRPVQQVRSLIPPRTHRPADDGTDDAPPSYEQAAKSTPYVPPAGHPSHPDSNLRSSNTRRRSTLTGPSNAGPSTPIRGRQVIPPVAAGGVTPPASGKERDCVVM